MMCDIKLIRVFLSCYKRILLSHQSTFILSTPSNYRATQNATSATVPFSHQTIKGIAEKRGKEGWDEKENWEVSDILLKKERFWEIDEEFLLEIGTCIGELMFAKLKVKTEQA